MDDENNDDKALNHENDLDDDPFYKFSNFFSLKMRM